MTPKFTPGPWKFVPWHIAEGPSEVRAPEGWLVCTTASDDDARLIAAAPDLLAALAEVSQWIEGWSPNFTQDDEWPATNARIRAAIAKAEGR
jgi:hypothetical protein